MATIAKVPENEGFEPLPAGPHAARCIHLIQLGTHEREYQGEVKAPAFRIRLEFEVPEERVTTKEGKNMPKIIGKEYTLSLHEKATLRKDLKGWRSVDFTDDEAKGFDVEKLVGVPCLISVVRSEYNGKTYANIDSVMRLPPALQCGPQEHASVMYNIEDGRNGVYLELPEWLRKKIDAAFEMMPLPTHAQPADPQDRGSLPF